MQAIVKAKEPVQLELFRAIEELGYIIVEVGSNIWEIIHTVSKDCYKAFGLDEVMDFLKFISIIPLSYS